MANVRRMRASLLLSKLIPMVPRAPIDAMTTLIEEALAAESRPQEQAAGGLAVRPVVRWFAEQMELALRRNDHKGGWHEDSPLRLMERLVHESAELEGALSGLVLPAQAKPGRVRAEAADVANMAMMVADHFREGGPSRDQGHDLPQEQAAGDGEGRLWEARQLLRRLIVRIQSRARDPGLVMMDRDAAAADDYLRRTHDPKGILRSEHEQAAAGGWVSVEASTPADNERVLALNARGEMRVGHYDSPTGDVLFRDGFWHLRMQCTHWIPAPPLPSPPSDPKETP